MPRTTAKRRSGQLLALPAMLAGIAVRPGLVHAGLVGSGGFVLFAAAGAVILQADWPLRGLGRAAQSLHNHMFARLWVPIIMSHGLICGFASSGA